MRAAIVGVRHARHLPDTLRLFSFELDENDLADIRHVVDTAEGPTGDIYSVERMKGGKHGLILRCNLNQD